jgi:methionyl-tRNA formyltransferase
MNKMKFVFFGSPRFAEVVLKKLLEENLVPVALVCNPDRPVGRKKIVTPPLTKQLIENVANIPGSPILTKILQPEKLDANFIERLRILAPDFFIVAAYAKIIPQTILDIPRLGTLGTHPSLLPKYRGASPIQSVILNGEDMTGATIYKMDAGMDSGPILAGAEWPIAENEQYPQLEEELALLSAHLLIAQVISPFYEGTIAAIPQDDAQATFTKKFKTEDGFVDEKELMAAEAGNRALAETILNKINAFTPEPGAWTIRNGKRIKLLAGKIADSGALKLSKIQIEGEKPKSV